MDFDDYVRASGPRLMRVAWLLTGDAGVAEELLQDAYLRLLPRWGRVAGYDDPDAYVRRMLLNGRTSRWRRLRREQLVSELPETSGRDAFADVHDRDRLAQALAGLGARQRSVVVARYYLDLTEAEIADVLGISTGTVKSQASRALAHLRLALSPAQQEAQL